MKTNNPKSTILVISTGFLVIHLLFSAQWAIYVSLVVSVLGIISNTISEKIEWLWFKLSKVLGYIIPNILLSLVFYLFLFPISLLFRLFNKDALMLSNKYQSYFVEINKESDKKSFEKIW